MRITGRGIWVSRATTTKRSRTLRRAVELGINLIDTADSTGRSSASDSSPRRLHPYPADLVIATKGGLTRSGPNQWSPDCRPEHLLAACDASLAATPAGADSPVPVAPGRPRGPDRGLVGACSCGSKDEGKIRHIGVCNVSEDQPQPCRAGSLRSSRSRTGTGTPIAARRPILDRCETEALAFLPWLRSAAAASSIQRAGAHRRRSRCDGPSRSCSPGCWRAHR